MREWRNWQTRTFEGRVVYTVRVQVPSLAPKKPNVKFGFLFFLKCIAVLEKSVLSFGLFLLVIIYR